MESFGNENLNGKTLQIFQQHSHCFSGNNKRKSTAGIWEKACAAFSLINYETIKMIKPNLHAVKWCWNKLYAMKMCAQNECNNVIFDCLS